MSDTRTCKPDVTDYIAVLVLLGPKVFKLRPASDMCSICESEILYDFIIKYENLDVELNYLVDRLSMENTDSAFFDKIENNGNTDV